MKTTRRTVPRTSRRIAPVLAVALVLFCGQPGLFFGRGAQTLPPAQDIPRPAHQVNVVINNVDVIVTDKDGRRITGLRPENFKIFEDGLPQKVSNFYEVQGLEVRAYAPDLEHGQLSAPTKVEAASSPGPPKTIVFYFDNRELSPLNRNSSLKTIESFIRKAVSAEKNVQGTIATNENIDLTKIYQHLRKQGYTSGGHKTVGGFQALKNKTLEQTLQDLRNAIKQTQKQI